MRTLMGVLRERVPIDPVPSPAGERAGPLRVVVRRRGRGPGFVRVAFGVVHDAGLCIRRTMRRRRLRCGCCSAMWHDRGRCLRRRSGVRRRRRSWCDGRPGRDGRLRLLGCVRDGGLSRSRRRCLRRRSGVRRRRRGLGDGRSGRVGRRSLSGRGRDGGRSRSRRRRCRSRRGSRRGRLRLHWGGCGNCRSRSGMLHAGRRHGSLLSRSGRVRSRRGSVLHGGSRRRRRARLGHSRRRRVLDRRGRRIRQRNGMSRTPWRRARRSLNRAGDGSGAGSRRSSFCGGRWRGGACLPTGRGAVHMHESQRYAAAAEPADRRGHGNDTQRTPNAAGARGPRIIRIVLRRVF